MNTEPLCESGMSFGPFPCDHFFHIEKCKTCTSFKNPPKVVEFILLRGTKLLFVEAKTSAPNITNKEKIADYIQEIKEKSTNSLLLFLRIFANRRTHSDETLPAQIKAIDLKSLEIVFVLTIKNHDNSWIPPLNDLLRREFSSIHKAFHVSSSIITVLNEDLARKHKLIF